MRIFAGGYGIQGFLMVPLLDALSDLEVKYEMVVNGLGGFYALVWEKFGREHALERLKRLVVMLWEDLRLNDRVWICEEGRKRWYKSLAVKHCYRWAVEESTRKWEEFRSFLDGIEGETRIGVEYFDLKEANVGVYRGDSRTAAMMSMALLGIFPPVEGRYLSTTYLTQIPVLSASQGDAVLDNLRDPSKCDIRKGDEVLAQSAELRAIVLARKVMEKRGLRRLIAGPITWSDLKNLDAYKTSILKQLEEIV